MHAVIQDIFITKINICREKIGTYVQKEKDPAIMPFATAVGNRTWASHVNGACNTPNNTGGITKRSLTLNQLYARCCRPASAYRSIGR
jgi:hypothetical protein